MPIDEGEIKLIDLRSDTVTKPTEAMRKACFEAEVGDDVYGEDPSVQKLEELAAKLLGKEEALFVTSGTQGNQIAVLTHCQPGNEIIIEEDAHIFYYEGAAISAFAGVQPRTIKGERGAIDPQKVMEAIRGDDIHLPETSLICLENTHNRAGGAIVPLENMQSIFEIASNHSIPVHLDGARLFNAAVALGTPLSTFGKFTSTIQVCLSKGLGAPIGSIIAGDKQFIKNARKWRKRLGGGMRQVGMIAAPGLLALETMIDRLADDHEKASKLADGLAVIKGIKIENQVETNIVLVNVENTGKTAQEFIDLLKKENVLAVPFGPYTVRFTTHYDVSSEQINSALGKINQII